MNRQDFYSMLDNGDVEVVFTKKTDGTTRVMRCTANDQSGKRQPESLRSGVPDTLITVFDTEAKGWRSFYSDNIQEVKPLGTKFGILQE